MQRRNFLKAVGCGPAAFSMSSAVFVAAESGVTADGDVVDIGSAKQLFVDDYLIERLTKASVIMNPPHKLREPVIVKDQPWELHEGCRISPYNTARVENGLVRMWYRIDHAYEPLIWRGRDYGASVFYAESEDGVHFTKPKLGLHEFHGSKENNLVIPGPVQGGTVWIDPRAAEEDRYRSQGNAPGGLQFFSSPDGIHWRPTHRTRIGKVDSRANIFWDEDLGRYILYTRYKFVAKNPVPKGEGGYRGHRGVRRLESDDLINWDNEKIVLQPDDIDRVARTSAIPEQPPVDYNFSALFRYPDENGLWFMLVTTYWHWFDRSWMGMRHPTGYNLGPNANDIRLAISRDGVNFSWVGDRGAFIRLGHAGEFDSRYLAEIPFAVRMGNELQFYYFGKNWEHGPQYPDMMDTLDPAASERVEAIGRVVMRVDGFTSVDAEYTGGLLITKPFLFSGDRLVLNADTSGGGVIQVEIQNLDGTPVAGYALEDCHPINGNSLALPVVWKEHEAVAALAGQPVRLRFVMADCKLYAFQFLG